MRTTIDPAGRIVGPEALRDGLGLAGGQELEIAWPAGHSRSGRSCRSRAPWRRTRCSPGCLLLT
jgi:hypothetical protein